MEGAALEGGLEFALASDLRVCGIVYVILSDSV